MTTERVRLGDIDVFGLREGFFRLDGGAMFGVVPKNLWEKVTPADSENRIRLGLNSLLVRTPDALVLVETGIGTKSDQKFAGIYSLDLRPGLVPALEAAGFRAEDVDFVINSHLHFDHCGGNTRRDEAGRLVPTFPRARYIIQRGEWEAAAHPNERDRASYLADNFVPLQEAGLLDLVLGDLVPTGAHVRLAYIMSYDLFPLETLDTRKRLYEQAVAGNWLLGFVHDPVHFFGRIGAAGGRYEFVPV